MIDADRAVDRALASPLSVNPFCPSPGDEWPTIDGAAFYGLPGEAIDRWGPPRRPEPRTPPE